MPFFKIDKYYFYKKQRLCYVIFSLPSIVRYTALNHYRNAQDSQQRRIRAGAGRLDCRIARGRVPHRRRGGRGAPWFHPSGRGRALLPRDHAAGLHADDYRHARRSGRGQVQEGGGNWTLAPRPRQPQGGGGCGACLLYTSDAADERSSVDLGGRRIIKKKKTQKKKKEKQKLK